MSLKSIPGVLEDRIPLELVSISGEILSEPILKVLCNSDMYNTVKTQYVLDVRLCLESWMTGLS